MVNFFKCPRLIRHTEPKNVMFVHGEASKMEFLKEKVEKEFGLRVYKPANGESITIEKDVDGSLTVPSQLIERSIALDPTPSKKFCPFRAYVVMDKQSNQLEVISAKAAARQFSVNLHSITFSDTIQLEEIDWHKIANKLRRFDPHLDVKQV
ncbi:unnamed protein product [Anisakis simplex]|uniref:Integrator complex subunit 11 (inferred by orthology to a human protein) n=1 Tax=Anisakis simplex TaxID=6269 RepID=A0A0M3JDC5_ANISI|nr:unnamed protein product [Anisakis simplex]